MAETASKFINEMAQTLPGGHNRFTLSIEFAKEITQRIPQGSDVCPSPYINGVIPEISDEAKRWLKDNGMSKDWREENNNITLGPDIRITFPNN